MKIGTRKAQKMSTGFRRGGMMSPQSSTSNAPPKLNVAVKIVEYVFAEKNKSNPDKDYANAVLLHDVPEWGMNADYTTPADDTEEPQPLTAVKIMMPLPPEMKPGPNDNDQVKKAKAAKAAKRRDLFGLSRAKGQGVAMDEGSIVIGEKGAFNAKEGVVNFWYAHGSASKAQHDAQLKHVFSDVLVCVKPEDYITKGERAGWAGRVNVLIADAKASVEVKSGDELAGMVGDVVSRSAIGSPGFMLLARAVCPEGQDPVEFAKNPDTRVGGAVNAFRKKVGEGDDAVWTADSAEQLLARFRKDHPHFDQLIASPDWMVEFIPMMAVNQASSLVPSKTLDGDRVRDNSLNYGIYGEVPRGPEGALARDVVEGADGRQCGMIDCGWMPSHVVCERKASDSDIWYTTYQNAMGMRLDVDSIHDVRTPLTPDYHVEGIKVAAAANVEGKKAHRAAKYPDNAPAPESEGPSPGM